MEFSEHAYQMLKERDIREDWVKLTLEEPENEEWQNDGTVHYTKTIEEFGSRILRVVVNPKTKPVKIITLFFDRRLRRQK